MIILCSKYGHKIWIKFPDEQPFYSFEYFMAKHKYETDISSNYNQKPSTIVKILTPKPELLLS